MAVQRFQQLAHWGAYTAVVEEGRFVRAEPFFRDAPEHLRPRLVLMDCAHGRWAAELAPLLAASGYREVMRTRTNLAFERA
jgi:hypothetical protein